MLEIAVLNPLEHFQLAIESNQFSIGTATNHSGNDVVVNDEYFLPKQCQIELVGEGKERRIKLVNLGRSIVLNTGSRIHNGVTKELKLPVSFVAGETQIEIFADDVEHPLDESISELPLFGLSFAIEIEEKNRNVISPSPATLTSWFDALGQIQRSAVGSSKFFEMAARGIFNPGGLDGGIILKRTDDGWESVARHIPNPDYGIHFRRDLVEPRGGVKDCVVSRLTKS